MKTSQKLTLVFVLLAILAGSFSSRVFADDEDESEGQEFLFMTEGAYTQEKGRWEVSFTSQYLEREISKEGGEVKQKNQWQWITEIEYGFSDWLQFEAEVPFEHVHKKTTEAGTTTHLGESGLGDIGTGIRVRLFEEDDDQWWSHTVSAGFELSWPSGRWRKDLGTDRFGWEASLSMSKTLDKWAYHLMGGFGMIDDAREQGETPKTDVEAFELGAALAYSPSDKLDFICELFAEFEREKSRGNENHETVFYAIPGIKYKLFEDIETGVGIPIGLTGDSYDWGVMAKIQYEW